MNYKIHNSETLARFKQENGSIEGEFTRENGFALKTAKGTPLEMKVKNADGDQGYEQTVSTLAYIKAEVVDQKQYQEDLTKFMTISQEGGFSDTITYFEEYYLADTEDGDTSADGSASGSSNLVNFKTEQRTVPIKTWQDGYEVTVMEMQQATQTNPNRTAISSKERAAERNKSQFTLEHAIIGSGAEFKGLLNLKNVTENITTIPSKLSALSKEQMGVVFSDMFQAYDDNCVSTAKPNAIFMSRSERIKLVKVFSEFNITTNAELLRKVFVELSENENFKLLSSRYGEATLNPTGKTQYALYNTDTVFMHTPVEMETVYTLGFNTKSDKMMRISSVYAERPQEVLYFTPVDEQ